VPRNIDSAHALAKGLGLPSSAVTVNGSAFFRCKPPDKSKETKLIAAALKSAPVPPNASALVALIDRTLGGKKHIAAEKNKVEDGKLKGRISLASMAAETFLMQHGAGVPLAWGKLTPDQMYDLQRMHVYEWAIDRSAEAIEAAKSSHMLATIVEALAANNTTTIFLGHDTDINGVGKLLDVGWSAATATGQHHCTKRGPAVSCGQRRDDFSRLCVHDLRHDGGHSALDANPQELDR
jgi:hypothetical protein